MEKSSDLTPMLAQYHHFKEKYKDCLLLFRLGDFYELFYEDAIVGSKELNLVLTSRPAGKGKERIPMCGVPYHSATSYIHRLVSKGYKVAICEQMEEASRAKGIVRREVIRVITPGTYFEREGSGFAVLYRRGSRYCVAYLNLSIGEFIGFYASEGELTDLLSKFPVKEVLIKKGENVPEELGKLLSIFVTPVEEDLFTDYVEEFKRSFGIYSVKALGFEDEDIIYSLSCAYGYAKITQRSFLPFIKKPKPYVNEGFVRIDLKARKGLELLESLEGKTSPSLYSVINRTLTGMGRRRLRFHIINPFRDPERIREIQDSVEHLVNNSSLRKEIREVLEGMPDLERIVSKVSSNMANPRDIVQLKNALFKILSLAKVLRGRGSPLMDRLIGSLEDIEEIARLIDKTLVDDPPIHLKEGGLIKDGVDPYLDELRYTRDNAERILREYEKRLREETGIQSLKIGYNRVMGYYIEVTKPNLKYVPSYFRRRQTLSNAERFITDELTRIEERILSAQTKINNLEYEIFQRLREEIIKNVEKIGRNAQIVGEIDYIQSLAQISAEKLWTKPQVGDFYEIEIRQGSHPVIEEVKGSYVPNDTHLREDSYIAVITGPNMAGKSSYIRQVAIITLLAHMGCFVPASSARIGVVDAIFTRIGSGDLLAMGVSTFMNEMLEVASILNNATSRSLIVLDEVGRGTSTYDGIAITKALIEYISERVRAKTLVATHFSEVTDLEGRVKGVKNYRMAVSRGEDSITFLYILEEGKAEGSFGIDVARMAGIPQELIEKAKEILTSLERGNISSLERVFIESSRAIQDRAVEELLEEIASVDVANTTPIQALLKLSEIKEKAKLLLKRRV